MIQATDIIVKSLERVYSQLGRDREYEDLVRALKDEASKGLYHLASAASKEYVWTGRVMTIENLPR